MAAKFGPDQVVLPSGSSDPTGTREAGEIFFNTTTGVFKYHAGGAGQWQKVSNPPPTITAVSPSNILEDGNDQVITVTGTNLQGAIGWLIDNNGTKLTPTTTQSTSDTSMTMTFSGGDLITNTNAVEPFTVHVDGLGGSIQQGSAINLNAKPIWATSSGSLGTVIEDSSGSFSVSASDPEGGSVSYSISSGALPFGMSLNSSTGAITGTANAGGTYSSSGVTHNFSINASDGSNSTSRAFSILRKWNDGSSSIAAASSAAAIKSLTGTTTNGTYWINVGGTATQIYCNMSLNGGGWMSFASAPNGGGWFGGNTGNASAWANKSYSYGTYSSSGSIGNYWRNYSSQSVSNLLFLTGNGSYWISFPIANIYTGGGTTTYSSGYSNSGNVDAGCSGNSYYTVMNRSGNDEDPWINAGNSHACGSNYMFWGENGHPEHATFKNNNGGIIVFVK